MRYFEITVKFGHVGKNKYYKGNLYLRAENGREAAARARLCPRVKHDHKDAILAVVEIDFDTFREKNARNKEISYFSCYNVQEQRECFCEIQDEIYQETRFEESTVKRTKKHTLRNNYNDDLDFDYYKNKRNYDLFTA